MELNGYINGYKKGYIMDIYIYIWDRKPSKMANIEYILIIYIYIIYDYPIYMDIYNGYIWDITHTA
jgi:hypothetical protein